jgi:hypothetical protein
MKKTIIAIAAVVLVSGLGFAVRAEEIKAPVAAAKEVQPKVEAKATEATATETKAEKKANKKLVKAEKKVEKAQKQVDKAEQKADTAK